jgi:hypothetical protein
MSAVIRKGFPSSKKAICSRIRGARSFPQGYQKKAQMTRREPSTSGP